MKSYTDLEQSKKLAEILPLESADMYYMEASYNIYTVGVLQRMERDMLLKLAEYYGMSPCWSLSALLSVLLDSIYGNTDEFSQLEFTKKSVAYIQGTTDGVKIGALKDNLVDACVDIIVKLNELNLL